MKKIIALVLTLVCLSLLGACGKTEQPPVTEKTRSLTEVYAEMEKILPKMTEINQNSMLNLYGLDAQLYVEAKVTVCSDGLRADEVWLIRAKDEAALAKIKQFAENRITAKDEESITYSPEQNKIVKEGQILVDGLDLALLVSPDVAQLVNLFNG